MNRVSFYQMNWNYSLSVSHVAAPPDHGVSRVTHTLSGCRRLRGELPVKIVQKPASFAAIVRQGIGFAKFGQNVARYDEMSSPKSRASHELRSRTCTPQVDCGRFPIKRVVGDSVAVEADIFGDGHDVVAAALLYRLGEAANGFASSMRPLVNDRWTGEFPDRANWRVPI